MSDEPRDQNGDEEAPRESEAPDEKASSPPEEPAEPASGDSSAGEVEAQTDSTPKDVAASEASSKASAEETTEEVSGADEEAKAKAEAAAKAKAAADAKAKARAAHEAAEAAKDPWDRNPVVPEWQDADEDPLTRAVRERHPDAIESSRTFAGDLTLEIRREAMREVCETLKNELGYLLPVDGCGAHYPDREEGQFEVVYHLYNFDENRRIRVKTRTDDGVDVPSVTPVWRGANWPEREAYDMYGVRFEGHPDMTRILLWEGFNGYPLRKDFPVEGIETGSAIYPEYYEDEAGPVAGTGTGWKPPEPPAPEPEPGPDAEDAGETPTEEGST